MSNVVPYGFVPVTRASSRIHIPFIASRTLARFGFLRLRLDRRAGALYVFCVSTSASVGRALVRAQAANLTISIITSASHNASARERLYVFVLLLCICLLCLVHMQHKPYTQTERHTHKRRRRRMDMEACCCPHIGAVCLCTGIWPWPP